MSCSIRCSHRLMVVRCCQRCPENICIICRVQVIHSSTGRISVSSPAHWTLRACTDEGRQGRGGRLLWDGAGAQCSGGRVLPGYGGARQARPRLRGCQQERADLPPLCSQRWRPALLDKILLHDVLCVIYSCLCLSMISAFRAFDRANPALLTTA